MLDDLFVEAGARAPTPRSASSYLRAFEKRLLDEEAHYIYDAPVAPDHPAQRKVKGWTITPSHYLNNQLDTVWLAE